MKPQVVSLVAKSGSGKTTLAEKLIAELKARGYRVGAIKHDVHGFEIDREGKDSWRMTRAGADITMISSAAKLGMVKINRDNHEPGLMTLVDAYFSDVDVVVVEGFKKSHAPKIEVHRKKRSSELLCRGKNFDDKLIAVASDEDLHVDVPLFHINDYKRICDFIVAGLLSKKDHDR